MPRGLNRVTLLGFVQPDDPEIRTFDDGNKVAKFKFVTDESYKDRDGNKVERASWHIVEFWGKAAGVIEEYVTKGKQLLIEGSIKYESWEENGEKKYSTKIRGHEFRFVGGGKRDDDQPETVSETPASNDDDLPF